MKILSYPSQSLPSPGYLDAFPDHKRGDKTLTFEKWVLYFVACGIELNRYCVLYWGVMWCLNLAGFVLLLLTFSCVVVCFLRVVLAPRYDQGVALISPKPFCGAWVNAGADLCKVGPAGCDRGRKQTHRPSVGSSCCFLSLWWMFSTGRSLLKSSLTSEQSSVAVLSVFQKNRPILSERTCSRAVVKQMFSDNCLRFWFDIFGTWTWTQTSVLHRVNMFY